MVVRKVLTIAQVNQRLPLVTAIVRDIVALNADISSRRDRLASIQRKRPSGSGSTASVYEEEVQQMESELLSDERRLDDFTKELLAIGGILTDAESGTVEFASELSGGDVAWLCWQPGDESVKFWHAGECGDSEWVPLCHETERT